VVAGDRCAAVDRYAAAERRAVAVDRYAAADRRAVAGDHYAAVDRRVVAGDHYEAGDRCAAAVQSAVVDPDAQVVRFAVPKAPDVVKHLRFDPDVPGARDVLYPRWAHVYPNVPCYQPAQFARDARNEPGDLLELPAPR
jgi:hypothetical protein